MKYFVDYEALVYNMPECNGFEFLDHQFIAHPVTAEDEKLIVPNNDMLKANFSFQACCLTYSDDHSSYITAQNKTPLEIACDNTSDDELRDKASEMVRKQIEAMEQHLILTTNLHIFFPVVKINIRSEDGQKSLPCGFMNNRPMPFRKWTWIAENINLECRLHFHLDKASFDKFRLHKSRTRYNRAFDYYIRSFYEFDHSSAFCILNRLQLCFFLIGHFLDHDLLKPVGVDIDVAVKKSDNSNRRHYDDDNNSEDNAQHCLA